MSPLRYQLIAEVRSRLVSRSAMKPGFHSVRWGHLALWILGAAASYGLALALGAQKIAVATSGLEILSTVIPLLAGWAVGMGVALDLDTGDGDQWPPFPRFLRRSPPIGISLVQWGATCGAYIVPLVFSGLVLGGSPAAGWYSAVGIAVAAWAASGVGVLWTAVVGWLTGGGHRVVLLGLLPALGMAGFLALGTAGFSGNLCAFLSRPGIPTLLGVMGTLSGLASIAMPGFSLSLDDAGPGRSLTGARSWGRAFPSGRRLFMVTELLRLWRRRGALLRDLVMLVALTLVLLRIFHGHTGIVEMVGLFLPFSLAATIWLPAIGSDGSFLEVVRGSGRLPEYLTGMVVPAVICLGTVGGVAVTAIAGWRWCGLGILVGVLAGMSAVGVGALAANSGQRVHRQDHVATWGHALYWSYAGTAATVLSIAGRRSGTEATVLMVSSWVFFCILGLGLLLSGVRRLESGE